jgi:acetyl esterase/lipase
MADPAIELRSGLTYATHDGVTLQGDLYLPQTRGSVPALVAVHGGGWQQGARNSFQHWGAHLARRGHALFAISYRFARKGQKAFPQAVQDVLAAVQYVRGGAAEFGIDAGRIGLFGASAGAHLAALAALGRRSDVFAGGYPGDRHAAADTRVKVLVGVYGVYDLVAMWEYYRALSPLDNNIENFLGAAPMENRQLYFDATPINCAPMPTTRPRCCSAAAPRTIWSTAGRIRTPSCGRSSRPDFSPAAAWCRAPGTIGSAIPSTRPAAMAPSSRQG